MEGKILSFVATNKTKHMKTAKGSTRRVFIFKNIVVKVARIYLYSAIRNEIIMFFFHLGAIRKNGKEYFVRKKQIKSERPKKLQEYEEHRIEQEQSMEMECPRTKRYECYGTMAICLMGGVMANYQEWKFYRETKNVFVMPTYFSLFGLLNIQKRGEKITFWDGAGVWCYIHENIQNHHQLFCDGHTLSEIDNFCLDNGRLKMVDYGSRSVEPFLKLNGENLFNNFKTPD